MTHTQLERARLVVLVAVLLTPIALLGDAGVLVPSGSSGPDPSILSLDEMSVDVRIDNDDARVSIRQVFGSHRAGVLESEYLFSLPSRATVSDFAVWDGVTRIPGVILERRRAEEIYDDLKQQTIDPGLLQAGERGAEGASEAARTSVFSARIVPIVGYGTKRLELEYHEIVPVENLKSVFALPLHPDTGNAQSAAVLNISFTLLSSHAIRDFDVRSRSYPLQIVERTANRVSGTFSGRISVLQRRVPVLFAPCTRLGARPRCRSERTTAGLRALGGRPSRGRPQEGMVGGARQQLRRRRRRRRARAARSRTGTRGRFVPGRRLRSGGRTPCDVCGDSRVVLPGHRARSETTEIAEITVASVPW